MSYKEHKCVQGTDEWHRIRDQLQLTGSNVGSALGLCPYKSREELLFELGTHKKVELNKAMLHGQLNEPVARKWYIDKFGMDVIETGIIVPDWDPEIGGSMDGLVGKNGIIEIKCPQRMYDFRVTKESPMGMPMYHFAQVQFYLAVTERDWCDYVVWTEKKVVTKRVMRNQIYWNKFMYPGIRKFISDMKLARITGEYPVITEEKSKFGGSFFREKTDDIFYQ